MNWFHLVSALLRKEPYFGSMFAARQGDPVRHGWMLAVLDMQAQEHDGTRPLDMVEVGSWAGFSTATWGLGLRERFSAFRITCVDPWQPYFPEHDMDNHVHRAMDLAVRKDLIFHLFQHNINSLGLGGNVIALRKSSREGLGGLPAASYDLIFVDGCHRYEEVVWDLAQARRLIRPGGIICGDDLELELPDVEESVLRQGVAQGLEYARDPRTDTGYHVGVTLAVWEIFGRVGVADGFWGVRERDGRWEPVTFPPAPPTLPPHVREAAAVEYVSPESLDTADYGISLVGETRLYNIVHIAFPEERYLACDKTLGHIDLLRERLGERTLGRMIIAAPTQKEALAKALAAERI